MTAYYIPLELRCVSCNNNDNGLYNTESSSDNVQSSQLVGCTSAIIISNDNQFIRITLGLNVNVCKMNNNNFNAIIPSSIVVYAIICQKYVNPGMVKGFFFVLSSNAISRI